MKRRLCELPPIFMLLIGLLVALCALLVFTVCLGLYSATTKDPTRLSAVMGLISLLGSGAVAAFVNRRIFGERGFSIALLSALLLSLLLLGIGLIASGGGLPPRCPVNYLCYLGVSLIAALLGKPREKRRRR
ncbi:MAG: hypothetical protein IJY24_03830 [Clostridia bacterium]|nr:hypothetical protein [Clostridia bacterium]